jgi:uncharacterized coiled-coil DUF342 family protein|tara:strand:+ start:1499 stop:1723 length:225 start_codon:yes stop_codon:yes gene_type:complete
MATKKATPVTDKLQAMNVPIIRINDKITQLENELRERQTMLQQYRKAITQLEAEANAILGSIQTCKELTEVPNE